jgi:sensor c-di-GMP phosphodiesterase-like protein
LQELTDVALRRAEVAVDFGAGTVRDIADRGPMNCDANALQAARLQVYQRSTVKDIRFLNRDGSVICSAYSETLEFDAGWVNRTDMLAAPKSDLRLFRVDQFSGSALGDLRDIDDKTSLVAILGIDSYVFDIMPAELRNHSEVSIGLSNGAMIGRFAVFTDDTSHWRAFSRTSSHYPLQASILIAPEALERWNNEGYWPIIILSAALGVAFGFLLAKIAREDGPVADLDRALLRREFQPFYQPTFDLKSGRIVGCEVLARWVKPDGTIVPPMSFIPLAESSGRIESITWLLLATALVELSPRLKADKYFKLSINVVPRHLLSDAFIETLRKTVAEARVSPRQVVLEITEREALPDLKKAAEQVAILRDYGFRIALDDVGVGHSGLSQIKAIGASTIKIDKFFVDTITRDSAAVAIVDMLVRLALELKMTVVAEGIETPDQRASLLACGVTEGQGYIVSAPLPFEKFDVFLDLVALTDRPAMAASELVA